MSEGKQTGGAGWAALVDSVTRLIGAVGAGVRWIYEEHGRRQARATIVQQRALTNARRLERYALRCWQMLVENETGDAEGARPGCPAYNFWLPSAPGLLTTGQWPRDRALRNALRDLRREVVDARKHINDNNHPYYGGAEEALETFKDRAHIIAGRALTLADHYRVAFRIPRRELAERDRRIDRNLRDEARMREPAPALHDPAGWVRRVAASTRLSAPARRDW